MSQRDLVRTTHSGTQVAEADVPLRKTREGWRLLRGTGIGYTVVRAIVLLVLLWALGATRYLPPFAEVFGWIPFT